MKLIHIKILLGGFMFAVFGLALLGMAATWNDVAAFFYGGALIVVGLGLSAFSWLKIRASLREAERASKAARETPTEEP